MPRRRQGVVWVHGDARERRVSGREKVRLVSVGAWLRAWAVDAVLHGRVNGWVVQ
jgi:hypothetical protein